MSTNPYHHFIDNHNHHLALFSANKHSSSLYNINSSKLLAHKSAFQVWKCVSFGCSLLAIALLLSKWHEVSTDLYLLIGIERVMVSSSSTTIANETGLSWPPVPLDQLLPAPNETSFGIESMENNETMLMSHLHMSLNREHNGNNLLRQEVDAFLGEFQKAKSTLGLSSLLTIIYIMSWIFMTLAINDTRISNDISLRNILLLSVYGTIDMAASVGFVMIRLVMYNFKNNSFVSQILDSNGLRDSQVRLTSDQLTAFTALRLIAMRSNSAYIDVYVTTLFSFLAILRLIGVLKGITYYKCLRQFTNKSQNQKQHHLDMEQQKTKDNHSWSNFFAGTSTFLPGDHHLISSAPSRPPVSLPDNPTHDISSNPAAYRTLNSQPINELRGLNGRNQNYQHDNGPQIAGQHGGSLPTSKLIFNNLIPSSSSSILDKAHMMAHLPQYHSSTMKPTKQASRDSPQVLVIPERHQHQPQQSNILVQSSSRAKSRARQHQYNNNNKSSANIFMVNGRAHRIIANEDNAQHSEPINFIQVKSTQREELHEVNNNEEDLQQQHRDQQEINASLPAGLSFRKLNEDDFVDPENSTNNIFANSEQNLLDEVMQATKAKVTKKHNETLFNTVRSNGTTYTLLSAAQLDKLSRKLSKGSGRNTINQGSSNKYRLIHASSHHANQASSTSSGKRDSGLAHDLSSTSSLSRSSPAPLSDTNSTSYGPDIESDASLPVINSRLERKRARISGIRQTEEQLVAANSMKVTLNKHNTQAKLSSGLDMDYFPGKSSDFCSSTKISPENSGSPKLSLQMSEIQAWSMASDEEDDYDNIINLSSNHYSEPSGILPEQLLATTTSRSENTLFKSNPTSLTFGCQTSPDRG